MSIVDAVQASLKRCQILDVLSHLILVRSPILSELPRQMVRRRPMVVNKAAVFIRGALVDILDSAEHLTHLRIAFLRVQELIDVLPLSRQDGLATHRVVSTSLALSYLLVMGESCFVTNDLCYVGVRRLHLLCNDRRCFGRS